MFLFLFGFWRTRFDLSCSYVFTALYVSFRSNDFNFFFSSLLRSLLNCAHGGLKYIYYSGPLAFNLALCFISVACFRPSNRVKQECQCLEHTMVPVGTFFDTLYNFLSTTSCPMDFWLYWHRFLYLLKMARNRAETYNL